jgi:protein involved in polysaccharide export with SLBB domain
MNTTFASNSSTSFSLLRATIPLLFSLLCACGPPITVPPLTLDEVPHIEEIGNYPHATYRIEPGDTLQISYTFHPEMKQDAVVQPDGKISATLAGPLTVGGLTTAEVENLLKEHTSKRLRDPEVVVSISDYAPKSVYVSGEVGKPGLIPYQKGLTPLQAITAANGFQDTAMAESVILVRTGGRGDEIVTRKLNLLETVTDGTKEPLHLAPHDIVYVPKTAIANADLWVKQHIRDLLPINPRVSP